MTAVMEQPDRIRRLILVGTGGPDSDDAMPPEPSAMLRFFYSDTVLKWRTAIPPLSVALMKVLSNAAFSEGPQPDTPPPVRRRCRAGSSNDFDADWEPGLAKGNSRRGVS